jgi:hypothetical protein
MCRNRIWTLILTIVSLIIVGIPASQTAHAAPTASAPTGKVPSSGIGLPANLPAKGVEVLQNSTYYERASKSSLWGQTLAGLVYQSCMYSVPNGSYVDSIHGRITEPDGKVLPMKKCPYPRLVPPGASPASGSTAAPGGTLTIPNTATWLDGIEADNLPHLYSLSASLAAPYPPNNTNVSPSLFEYQWTALGNVNAPALLQPALGWGRLTASTWRAPLTGDVEMAAYYYWGGDNVAAGTFYSVKPLDTVRVSILGYNCGSGGGDCTWSMQMTDENSGQVSQLTVGSSPVYTSVIAELESDVGSTNGNCQSLFANHHLVWRDLTVASNAGTVTDPFYYETGYNDIGTGKTVWNDSYMNTSWSTTSDGETAADTTWSNACTGF